MQTPWVSIGLYVAASVLGASGQFFYKSGAEKATGSLSSYLVSPWIWGGVICYVGVMILFVAALRRGGSLSVLYPVYATTFIWAALISRMAYGTPIKSIHIAGMALLILGMFLMGK